MYKKNLMFAFHCPTKVSFGVGFAKNAGSELQMLGAKRALLVTDEGLRDNEIVASVKDSLKDKCVAVFSDVIPDSSHDIINKGIAVAKENEIDSIVSVGGGSSMDSAKGILAALAKGVDDCTKVIGFMCVGKPTLPHVAIPTTSGTASEVTMYAVVKDREKNVKQIIVDPNLIPAVGILDPKMTETLPPDITAATGMDAMTHAIECLSARNYNPISDGLALHAVKLMVRYLPVCVENGSDLDARGMQAIASNIAGMAFENALVGMVHAAAHAIGGIHGVPHGVGNSIFLHHGMRFNSVNSAARYRPIVEAFGRSSKGMSDEEAAHEAADLVEDLTKRIGLPQTLKEVGIKEEDIDAIAKLASTDGAMMTNPRRVSPDEMKHFIRDAF